MAFRYYKAAPLQKLSFLPNLWNFTIDILFLHVNFSTLQMIGFMTLFTYYALELIHFYFIRDHEADESGELKYDKLKDKKFLVND